MTNREAKERGAEIFYELDVRERLISKPEEAVDKVIKHIKELGKIKRLQLRKTYIREDKDETFDLDNKWTWDPKNMGRKALKRKGMEVAIVAVVENENDAIWLKKETLQELEQSRKYRGKLGTRSIHAYRGRRDRNSSPAYVIYAVYSYDY